MTAGQAKEPKKRSIGRKSIADDLPLVPEFIDIALQDIVHARLVWTLCVKDLNKEVRGVQLRYECFREVLFRTDLVRDMTEE